MPKTIVEEASAWTSKPVEIGTDPRSYSCYGLAISGKRSTEARMAPLHVRLGWAGARWAGARCVPMTSRKRAG